MPAIARSYLGFSVPTEYQSSWGGSVFVSWALLLPKVPGGAIGTAGASLGQRELFLNDLFARLHEFGLRLYAQASGVVKQFVNALVRDLSIQQLAHPRARAVITWAFLACVREFIFESVS